MVGCVRDSIARMNKLGRPPIYTPELARTVCDRLAKGESLRAICRDPDMPARVTVHGWIIDDVNGFAAQYTRAREIGLDELADELVEISDDGSNDWMEKNDPDNPGYVLNGEHSSRSRLRVDTRKWYLSKLAPKRYGDKTAVELTGANGGPVQITDTERAARIAAILESARRRAEQPVPPMDASEAEHYDFV